MFPLGTVLFPYAMLPLHVFEERYRVMTRRIMQSDREFGVVLIERGSEVGGGDVRFDTGTVARVVHANELADGRYALATVGIRRVRVARWLPDDPYPRAEVGALNDDPASDDDAAALGDVLRLLAELHELARRLDPRVAELPPIDRDPVRAAYEVAAFAPIGPLDAQRVLEAPSTCARLRMLDHVLAERTRELRARLDEGQPGE